MQVCIEQVNFVTESEQRKNQIATPSFRVAIVFGVIIIIVTFFSVAAVFLFLVIWFFPKKELGSRHLKNVRVLSLRS
jgi:hypothetical protein